MFIAALSRCVSIFKSASFRALASRIILMCLITGTLLAIAGASPRFGFIDSAAEFLGLQSPLPTSATTFSVTTAEADGLSASSLNNPVHLFFDNASQNLFVADTNNNRVLRFAPAEAAVAGVQFSTASETINASAGAFSIPVTLTGTPSTTVTTFASGFNGLVGLAFDAAGN